MKHVKRMSKVPALAAPWQELVCTISGVAAEMLGLKGGGVPVVTYLDTKCEPNPDLET
ncbi:MAG: hypothetical protein WC655_08275 [Candidatus Hydrogenedentales bacterium]